MLAQEASGIHIYELAIGSGAMADRGKEATIHYRGFLNEGDEFRNTYDDGEPLTFSLGQRQVVAGLEQGIVGMRVGGKRRIRVSPHLAYGKASLPGIPANAILVFEVELIGVQG